ncbi:MAG: M14 family metallopeptidase [Pyrinomonadaceae bacterium]|nr:M14 family metallopeptidase [Pyrinomonadaceae bacterium]
MKKLVIKKVQRLLRPRSISRAIRSLVGSIHSDPVRRTAVVRAGLNIWSLLFIALFSAAIAAQVPSPRSVLGFEPADDRTIADWKQITDYFAKLDSASRNVLVKEIGRSVNGKPLIAAFISSEKNIKELDRIRAVSARLADPRTVRSDEELERLIRDGKTIVAISCSIHSTEIVASQMSMTLAYELATATDAATKEILDNTVLLLIPSPNPDGIDIVADWYRKTLGTKSEGTAPPELYHHYAGHDDNRDWFMLDLPETQAVTRFFWQEWFPQIVYDVHQQGRNASRFIIPPFFDPVNPRVSPSILREVGSIGYKVAADLQAQGIAGVATNSTYDTWWHGGFRSAPYYHNSIGILSEAASADLMSPVTVTADDLKHARPVRGLPNLLESSTNYPDPWKGGVWRPADIAKIEMIASRSILQMAAKFRSRYLRQFYDRGRENLQPKDGVPQAFVIMPDRSNAETVSRLIEILMTQGIEIFEVPGSVASPILPAGSFMIFTDQPQRNNILSLFERQAYPHRILPNGEAEVPYDVAGWTLPLQMGVRYAAVTEIADIANVRKRVKRVDEINDARKALDLKRVSGPFAKKPNPLKTNPRIGLYKGYAASMDEGWTRFVLDTFQIPYRSLSDADMREGRLDADVIILPSDSERTIISGLSAERYPAEFAGGIGEAGVEDLKRFVSRGGRLVCFDASCKLVIERFILPVRNVLATLKRSEFYDPGSIVQIDIDQRQHLAKGIAGTLPAYFTNSSAFEVAADGRASVVARYAENNALLSGWMLGERYLNGKAALVEVPYGKGSVVLFAFRPQHRGQSWATFPLLFNTLEKP